jgi:hypothetical protein
MWTQFISKKFVIPHFLVLFAVASILFRSFVPPACTKAVSGPLGTTFVFNCDSAQFMQDSQNPARIFNAETSYQDRPLYAMLSHGISILLRPFLSGSETFTNAEGQLIQFKYSNLTAFLLIHFVIIFLGLSLLLKTSWGGTKVGTPILMAVVSTVFLNDIIKGFFWTPHTQVFSIYMICFAFYSWGYFQKKRNETTANLPWFILSSVQIFFYPILVLVLLIPIALNWKKFVIPSIAALLPYLIYPSVLQAFGGEYRNPQTDDFNQFVWIFDRNVLDSAIKNVTLFIQSFSMSYVILILILLICLFLGSSNWQRWQNFSDSLPILVFLIGYFLFLYFMGLYATRLPIPFLIGVAVLLLININRRCSKKVSTFIGYATTVNNVILFFFFQGTLS